MKLNITGLSPVQQSACAELSRLLHIELEPSGVNVQISKSDDTGSGISVTYDGTLHALHTKRSINGQER